MRLPETRLETYILLTRVGHSPEKALEIAIAYERGESLAIHWVEGVAAGRLPVRPDKTQRHST